MSMQVSESNHAQASAIQALANISHATSAADERIQLSNEQLFNTMKTALEQSEANNKTLSDRNVQLASDNQALQQKIQELMASHKAQLEAMTNAAKQRENAIKANIQAMVDGPIQHATNMHLSAQQMRCSVINPYPGGGYRRADLENFIAGTTTQNYNQILANLSQAISGLQQLKAAVPNT